MSRRLIIPVVGWLVGSIAWAGVSYVITRLREHDPMIWSISAIGFLVLIVVGVVGIGWYFWRERQPSNASAQLESMARTVTAVYFSQIHGVAVDELQDAMTPQEMEEKAKRLKAERELAELRGHVTPSTIDTEESSSLGV